MSLVRSLQVKKQLLSANNMSKRHLRIAAFVSGSGSNLPAIIEAIESGYLNAEIVQIIASKYNIPAEIKAQKYDIPYTVISRQEHKGNIQAMGQSLMACLEPLKIDLILLCGYLSFLSSEFVAQYPNRIMNIHPSLLPAFGGKGAYGMNVHNSVIEYGSKVSGCTVMFVDAGADSGPIIIQRSVQVSSSDNPDSLATKVMNEENIAYPEAIRLFSENRLLVDGRVVRILE